MADRAQLLEKIRKLLYATTGRTPAELKTAHNLARALMKKHGITRAEVFAKTKAASSAVNNARKNAAPATITFELGGFSVRWRF